VPLPGRTPGGHCSGPRDPYIQAGRSARFVSCQKAGVLGLSTTIATRRSTANGTALLLGED